MSPSPPRRERQNQEFLNRPLDTFAGDAVRDNNTDDDDDHQGDDEQKKRTGRPLDTSSSISKTPNNNFG